MFDSKQYWIDRYERNRGNSGVGSYGVYATYKAKIINKFVLDNNIETVCELGCGDGNQTSLFIIKKYFGYDVSSFIINENKKKIGIINNNYVFSDNINDFTSMKYDLTLSLDVIYHLIEENVYHEYMSYLFDLSNKYVIIYSLNENIKLLESHNRFRDFLLDVPKNFILLEKIENPLKGFDTQSDFYIFKCL